MQEKWIRWEPVQGLVAKYYIDYIIESYHGFRIYLSDDNDNNKVEVNFKISVDAYKNTNESYQLTRMDELKKLGVPFGDWTFFKVENSSYIQWLSQQTYGIIDSYGFMHFCFITADSFLDVVAAYEPSVVLTEDTINFSYQ